MNVSIKFFFITLWALTSLLAIFISINMKELYDNSKILKDIEKNRFLMIQKADELRQSTDDLTRFARTYTVTLNKKYKDNYFRILDIREGRYPRPENYQDIYWDLQEPLRSQRHPLTKKTSLQEEISKLPYLEWELLALKAAKSNSDQLVKIEIEAFNALEGKFLDENAEYTVQKAADQAYAIKLLHSEVYHKAKENILFPIDAFLLKLRNRTQERVDRYNTKISNNLKTISTLFSIGTLVLLLSVFFIVMKILIPIKKLTLVISKFQRGEKALEQYPIYNDEIGMMTKQFFDMKEMLDEKYNLVKSMTLTDDLTKIYNRKFYDKKLLELLSLYNRYKQTFSLIMFDIDNFKQVNDTYGHDQGDRVLIEMSNKVSSIIREEDWFCRIGGEEFMVLLPETNMKNAKFVAQKIRVDIQNLNMIENHQITISLGVTQIVNGDDVDSIFKRVDKLLYRSKKSGKNRVSYG